MDDIQANITTDLSSSARTGGGEEGEILVRFFTNQENIRIPSEPIAVPSNINRIGLGAIITHLLGKDTNDTSTPLSFEFTIAASQYALLKAQQQQSKDSSSSLTTSTEDKEGSSTAVLGRTLLRTTLRKYIAKVGLSLEDIVSLEYGPAVQPPRPSERTMQTPDWITSIICGSSSTLFTGLSNGTFMISNYLPYVDKDDDGNNEKKKSSNGNKATLTLPYAHNQTISSISLYEIPSVSSSATVVTGGHDGIVKVWQYTPNNHPHHSSSSSASNTSLSSQSSMGSSSSTPTCEQQYELLGCVDRCDSVAIDPTIGHHIVGGDAQGNVYFWNIGRSTNETSNNTMDTHDDQDDNTSSSKKVGEKRSRSDSTKDGSSKGKGHPSLHHDDDNGDNDTTGSPSSSSSFIRTPYFQAKGRHNDRVSGVAWLSSAQVATGSWDHTIAIWDTEETRPLPVTLLRCGKVITSLSSSPLGSLVATAHPDHVIRIWDSRGRSSASSTKDTNNLEDDNYTTVTTEAIGLKSTLLGQSSWINSVSWCHNSAYYVSGIGYDGQALLWDIRAPNTPLYTLDKHTDKGLCVTWNTDDSVIITGGADGQIRFNSVQV